MQTFDDRVVLVTGGTGGIGAATARLFAQRGATVIAADLRAPLPHLEEGLAFLALDVTSEDSWAAAVAHIMAQHGRLDVLVNAAGIVGDVVSGTLERTTLAEWRRVMAVNLDGTFLGCREAMAAMAQQGKGAIINVASVVAYYPTTQSVAYGASKGGAVELPGISGQPADRRQLPVRARGLHPHVLGARRRPRPGRRIHGGARRQCELRWREVPRHPRRQRHRGWHPGFRARASAAGAGVHLAARRGFQEPGRGLKAGRSRPRQHAHSSAQGNRQ